MRTRFALTVLFILIATQMTGCTSYVVPGPGADMEAFGVIPANEREQLTDRQIQRELDIKPLATFPVNLCIAHVQGVGYRNMHGSAYGYGAYSVVTTREVETEEQLNKLAGLPMIRGVAMMNRMLLPADLQSDKELRQAAAKLHTQILLVYTFDTDFYNANKGTPLDVITLGFGPHQKIRITCTASAALLDVRNGYVYGVAEATSEIEQSASSWNNKEKADEARRQAEAEAFDKLVNEVARTWSGVVQTYAGVYPTTGGQ